MIVGAKFLGKNISDMMYSDLLNAQIDLHIKQGLYQQLWGTTGYQEIATMIEKLILKAKEKQNMGAKYYSSSRKEWIEISTMQDTHLKNAFGVLCREHNVSGWIGQEFYALLENNQMAREMLNEIITRFAKMV